MAHLHHFSCVCLSTAVKGAYGVSVPSNPALLLCASQYWLCTRICVP